ncbi:MAG TPA: hypothetical protein PLB32_13900, partial [Acidobacteriota bacterium]|nr:hypothetical protein [Acidobacteriota bacterium]
QKGIIKKYWFFTSLLIMLVPLFFYFFSFYENDVFLIFLWIIFPLFIYLFIFSFIFSFRVTFSVRVCLLLEWEKSKPNPYEKIPLALKFKKTKGKMLARNYQTLVKIAQTQGFQKLRDFGQVDVHDKQIIYYDPGPAIEAIKNLLFYIENNDLTISSKTIVIEELSEFLSILKEAKEKRIRFCIALL